MPAVILSVILGTVIGLAIHLGTIIQNMGMGMEKIISKIIPGQGTKDAEYQSVLVTAIVLFCASGTGIYGSITAGMTGDHSILLAKTILDLPTAFNLCLRSWICNLCNCNPSVYRIHAAFLLAGAIYPFCTETMICDFKAWWRSTSCSNWLPNDESERISCSRYDTGNDTRHAIKPPLGNICTSFCFLKRFQLKKELR